MSYAKPVVQLPDGRKLMILEVRSKQPDGPVDEAQYCILGCNASPVWVSVAGLRPIIERCTIIDTPRPEGDKQWDE